MQPMLIVDADDTLWENNIYYDQCIAAFAELMAEQGFGREEAMRTMDTVERERIPLVGSIETLVPAPVYELLMCQTKG